MRIIAIIAGVMMLFCPLVSFASPVHRTAENALLPEGKEITIKPPKEEPRPLWPGCGELQIGWGTCTVYDGYIDEEWDYAAVYDVSDTCGQGDGIPNPLGSCYLYVMKDDRAIYFGVDAVADSFEDYYDGCKFYFDDSDDGCWPLTETNEGWITMKDDFGNGITMWCWCQEDGSCAPNPDCGGWAEWGSQGGYYLVESCGWAFGTASGHMQYEFGIFFGAMADDEWEIQTDFNQGESCGIRMYCIDQYYYEYVGWLPCTESEYYWFPCNWPSLVGVKPDFTFSIKPFQTHVPIGGTLDFAKHFHNNTCQTMTIHDTLYVYKGGNPVKTFAYEWAFECEQDLDLCFALQVPEKDQFICWDITIVNSGVAVAGGNEYPFSDEFDVHIEPGHKSEVICPD